MSEDVTITQRADAIGRIMIPKHVRDVFGIEQGDLVEIVIKKKIAGKQIGESKGNPLCPA
ncbi:AbrB/MazE/SpoVT family DNA-binding domain-containing protein [Candidatus Pacearchaeota archaeon]|jgi:AbrB family looped-hinge helix DNA binding protein|nr:AbrB/MazE/SpoVT family DNA-binding domain-containing protein [Candidatus Pacearchaeota archaeon]